MRIIYGVAAVALLGAGWFAVPGEIKAQAAGFMVVCEDTAADLRAGIDALVEHFAGPGEIEPA
ncbi:MAG: hypothetical protein ABL308_02220 [Oceanicaulis sp.]